MEIKTKAILDKMKKVIETSDSKHKRMAARYICLANKRLHRQMGSTSNPFGIVGASMALKSNFEEKFGSFRIEDKPITG